MIHKENIEELVEEKIAGTDIFLVDVKVSSANLIQVEIDSENGISVSDCVEVSRHVEFSLDREKEDFELQVSSPGVGQPLKKFRQYKKNIGRNAEVLLEDGIKHTGKLVSCQENEIALEEEVKIKDEKTKKKKTIRQIIKIPLNKIKETKITVSFK
jgi:ribosome maturation factor RimP